MGRVLMYTILAALAVFVLAAAFVVEHGGGAIAAATEVSVHDLSTSPHAYTGERVSTEGVLRRIVEPEEHFVVTADGLSIVIRGYSVEKLRRLDGKTVSITGRFSFDEATGVYIEADSLTPLQ